MVKRVGWKATEGTMDYYELLRTFQQALIEEITTIKTKAPDVNLELNSGSFLYRSLEYFVYRFPTSYEIVANDDTPLNIFIGYDKTDGFIVTSNETSIDISLVDDFGPSIKQAKVTSNKSTLFEMLNDRFDEILHRVCQYNIIGCMKLFGFSEPHQTSLPNSILSIDSLNLNNDQKLAVQKSLSQEITFIWGPPGTGKTKTLSVILNKLIKSGKTVLLVSHTNLALDEVFKKFAEDPENRPFIDEGKVIRHGNISNPDHALNDFRLDNIKKRKIGQRYEQIANLKKEIKDYERTINGYSIVIESAEYQNLKWYEDDLEEKRIQAGILRKKLVPIILQISDMKKDNIESSDSIVNLKKLVDHEKSISSEWENAEKLVLELKKKISETKTHLSNSDYIGNGEDVDHLIEKIDLLKVKINECQSRIESIEKIVSVDKDEIFNNALVIGCTLTKSYLDMNIYHRFFDIMILDEASMANLPSIFFTAGLASRYVISGDFRQLPPIAKCRSSVAEKWLKRDIFEQSGIIDSVNNREEDPRLVMLREQYRMHPQIAGIINDKMYDGQLITNDQVASDRVQFATLPPFENEPVVMCDTSRINPWSSYAANSSKMNLYSALLSTRLAEMAIDGGMKSVGIITPYRQQVKVIDRLLGERNLNKDIVSVTTIHKAQGNERDCIIIDLVEGPPYNVGRMLNESSIDSNTARLLNVAISRAKGKLILVVNRQYFIERSKYDNFVRELLDEISKKGTIIDANGILSSYPVDGKQESLPGMAEVTPDSKQIIYDEVSFDKVFIDDIDRAGSRVVIFSPFITRKRMKKLNATLKEAVGRGVDVYLIVRTQKEDTVKGADIMKLIKEIEEKGIKVIIATEYSGIRRGFHEKIALIDNNVFYFGSLNILSHSNSSESMFAFTNPQTIEDLVKYFKIDTIVHRYKESKGQSRMIQIPIFTIDNGNPVADALCKQGIIRIGHQNYEEAVKSLKDAIKIYPNASEYHYYLSTALLKLNIKPEAVDEINTAIELSPDNDDYLKFRGSIKKQ